MTTAVPAVQSSTAPRHRTRFSWPMVIGFLLVAVVPALFWAAVAFAASRLLGWDTGVLAITLGASVAGGFLGVVFAAILTGEPTAE